MHGHEIMHHSFYTTHVSVCVCLFVFFFFFNDTATTEIYTLSLHDALPISLAHKARCDSADGEAREVRYS